MPPAAPLPTTMTSHGPDFGVMDEAIRFDSETTPPRLRERVGSGIHELSNEKCKMQNVKARLDASLFFHFSLFIFHFTPVSLLPTPLAVLPIDRLAAHELWQRLVALVAEFLVDPDLRRVVAVDGGVLGGDEELLERSLG